MRQTILGIVLAAAAGSAQAQVFRCTNAIGETVYQGWPCAEAGHKVHGLAVSPGALPAVADSQPNPLVGRYQARVEARQARRAREAEKARAHIARQSLVRDWIRSDIVGPGMTPDEVRQVWGAPDEVDSNYGTFGSSQMWIYRTGLYSANYVHFDDGLVTSVSLD